MKKILLSIPVAVLVFTGCTPQKQGVYADFIMPPKKIKDINEIKNIKIDVSSVRVDGLSSKFKSDIKNMIEGRFASSISKEQFLNVSDKNLEANRLNKLSQLAFNHHGYDKFHTQEHKNSTMKVTLNIKKKIDENSDNVKLTLVKQNYKVEYTEGDYPAPMSVPSGDPIFTYVNKTVPYIKYNITVDLNAKIYNNDGKLIYEKSFNNINLNKKIGGANKTAKAIPTDLELVSTAVSNKIDEIVKDISPYKETRALHVNEKGDKTSVVLIKATAFNDAAYALDEHILKLESDIEKQEQEIELKYEEKLKTIEKDEEKKEILKQKDEDISKLYTILSPDYENMGLINEILGDTQSAVDYYSMAFEFDPNNKTAKSKLNRLQSLIEKQNEMRKITKTVKSKNSYKNQDNKDR